MQRDDVMEMAKEAGVTIRGHYDESGSTLKELEAFAKLVADKTRKELREEIIYTWVPPHFVDLAVKEEREACARVCDTAAQELLHWRPNERDIYVTHQCAEAIRARGEA